MRQIDPIIVGDYLFVKCDHRLITGLEPTNREAKS